MEEKKKVSAAQARATKKYEDKVYDKVLLRLPKGTKDRINASGKSLNGFINDLVMTELENLGL